MDVKATTGAVVVMMGLETRFSSTVIPKRSTSNSNETAEVETMALSHAIRQHLRELLLGCPVETMVFEDDEETVLVVENGYSPVPRHLLKTQTCFVNLVHIMFHELNDDNGLTKLENIEVEKQTADIFIKTLSPQGWLHALNLLHVGKHSDIIAVKRDCVSRVSAVKCIAVVMQQEPRCDLRLLDCIAQGFFRFCFKLRVRFSAACQDTRGPRIPTYFRCLRVVCTGFT